MANRKENKDGKRNGLITTLLVHACLLILCLFLGFTFMTPPKGDVSIGFEALGTENAGSTDDLATSKKVSDETQEVPETASKSQNIPDENYKTQEESPVEVAKNTSTAKKNTSESTKESESTEAVEKEKEVDPRLAAAGAAIQGPDNPDGKGAGGKGPGEGTPDGTTNVGPPGGGSTGVFDFSGRTAVNPGNLKHDCGVRATADVRVTVDKSGKVIEAIVVGGTNLSACIEKKAIAAAKGTKYTPKSDGPKYQEGTISLNFHVN
ncbi:MAG: outer membrane biosynthesis protein TonB [Glaciecola sp.]|jgi:outer membrane biosynthesis protein TonB